MKHRFAFFAVTLVVSSLAWTQTWTRLNNTPPFNASTALVLTDGNVMVQNIQTGQWWLLTPDNTGSYINGSWSQRASMQTGYGPLYYASAILPDGRLLVVGGEYNVETSGFVQDWTPKGSIFDPLNNTWTGVNPPANWNQIGDAQSSVLSSGTFMLADPFNTNSALFNIGTFTWSAFGSGKQDVFDEEGWTLLPSGQLLTVDANNPSNLTNSEIFDPNTGGWSSAGSTIVKLPDTNSNNSGSHELGPAMLRPDGTVFATGGTSNTAIYNTFSGSWSVGPTFSSGLDVADGPAALLPSGNVLVSASPGVFQSGSQFFEFDGANLISVPGPPRAAQDSSYQGRMVLLPTGQVLFTDGTNDVEVYTPSGSFQSAWQPVISSVNASLGVGSADNPISGTQFNGLSQGASYGDDVQSATNFPLVQITNSSTGHIFYAKTHDPSTMGVATGSAPVSTQFDIPANVETGASTLQVVANGIPSAPVAVNIVSQVPVSALLADLTQGVANYTVGDSFSLTAAGQANQTVSVVQTTNGSTGSPFNFGQTGDNGDGTGSLVLNGSWAATDAGVYTQVWSVGGVPASTLNFVVSPLVQLVDNSRSDGTFHVGDSFTLTVQGQANQPVSVVQNTNGSIGNSTVLGSTDGNGLFSVSGTWATSDAGNYSQVWSAGNLQARPVLVFTILNP